jgi:Methylamine utilisation protein MauE
MPAPASISAVLELVETQLAVFLALLLSVAAVHKIIWRARARRAAGALTGMEWRGTGVAVKLASLSELGAAGLLALPACRPGGAVLAALVWSAYFALIARSIVLGRRDLDCGCSFGAAHRPLGSFQLLRCASLVLLAFVVAALCMSHTDRDGAATTAVDADSGTVMLICEGLAAVAMLALYAALDQLMSLRPLRAGAIR